MGEIPDHAVSSCSSLSVNTAFVRKAAHMIGTLLSNVVYRKRLKILHSASSDRLPRMNTDTFAGLRRRHRLFFPFPFPSLSPFSFCVLATVSALLRSSITDILHQPPPTAHACIW